LAFSLDELVGLLDQTLSTSGQERPHGCLMRCLIVDDDPVICDLLEYFCQKAESISSVTKTNSGFESVNLINNNMFDGIFLDFNLPDFTGREILKLINPATGVVMITSHKDFAAETYNQDNVVDFLIKPIDFTRFFASVKRLSSFLEQRQSASNFLFIKEGNKLVKVDLTEVLYFKGEANYVSVVMSNRKILTLMTLKELEQKLPDFFQRVHRSYIVNINKIDTIEVNSLDIEKSSIPISQSYESQLLRKINLLN
jgi:two-component system, LytTR family, response regulator